MSTLSYLDSNAKKKANSKKQKVNAEERELLIKHKDEYEKFRKLCDYPEWKECVDFVKEEIYKGLNLSPGEAGVGDWWLKYCWGLKSCIERFESHAKKYDEAIKMLSE